jgi:uncharacterized phage protein gp47/JayE
MDRASREASDLMPFPRPTLSELIDRIVADLSSRLVGVDGAVMRRSILGIIGRCLAGASHELHGRLDFISKQCNPATAEGEFLEDWANVWGQRRAAATYAGGNVTFTGNVGAEIPAGTVLQRQDGALFETDALGRIIVGTSVVVHVSALEAGTAGNCEAGVALTLQQPVAGVQSRALVAAGGLASGEDPEDDEGLRERLLRRVQQPPHGGADFDYQAWALEVPGVSRAWVYPMELGAGTVTVRFVRDDDASIIPDAGEVAAVQAYIDARRPVTADVTVVAPIAVPLDMTIQLNPLNAATQAAIEAEVADLIRREATPGGTILISHLREAVSTAAGELDHVITVPAGNKVHTAGQIAVPGAITFAAIP